MNFQRYGRQIILKEFGEAAQRKLMDSRILVAGAGGLGCPVLTYLAAAGAGVIGIADFDTVELSNIHRQPLFRESDCGQPKAGTAAGNLSLINSGVRTEIHNMRISNENAIELISKYDVVIDCTDNFATRYIINDACFIAGKPLVYGAVLGFEGQAGVFNIPVADGGRSSNYRDLFPEPPEAGSVFSCSESGVLGAVPGVIGCIQAAEAIKIVTGTGIPLRDRIISYNALRGDFYEFEISKPREKYSMPANEEEFRNYDYNDFCGQSQLNVKEITCAEFLSAASAGEYELIDVREDHEPNDMCEFEATRIPLSKFADFISKHDFGNRVVICCEAGVRSRRAVELLQAKRPDTEAYSLRGGIRELRELHKTKSKQ